MPLFIYSLLDRNGLKFGDGPSMMMISDKIDLTRVTSSGLRADWFRPVRRLWRNFGKMMLAAPDARGRPIAAQP